MLSNNLRSYDQVVDYLTPEAKRLIQELYKLGVTDRDLAITILEESLPEEFVYQIPEEEPNE